MDYVMNRDSIAVCEPIFDGCAEQPIDIDYTLPDYCPDIQKILKCQSYPKIYTRNISGDRLDIDGSTVVRIMYIDAIKKTIRCCEHSSPFSCSFNLKSVPQNAVVVTRIKPEYVNCRALSPRRLDIHGAFTICARVVSKGEQEYVSAIEGDDVQVKRVPVTLSSATGLGQQPFTVSEVIELGNAKSPVESILRSGISAVISDAKAVANKLMIKGDLNLRLLYLSDIDSGSMDTLEYTAPFSQIIDVDGIDEDSLCDARVDLMSHDLKLKSGFSDEEPVLELEAKLVATATGYRRQEAEFISDAFSTQNEMELTHKQIPLCGDIQLLNDSCISKSTVELPDSGVSKIIDIWCENPQITAAAEDGKAQFGGKFNACILALDAENEPFYMERAIDINHTAADKCGQDSVPLSADACVVTLSYRLNGNNGLDLRAELKLCATMAQNRMFKAVSDAFADKERAKADDNTALTLYFADKNESVWNIARKYATGVAPIMEENDLSDDILGSRCMLLIPNK